jgi:hypothetical protein
VTGTAIKNNSPKKDPYRKFNSLDGSHPFKKVNPDGYVDYPARVRKGAKIRFFNFDLAVEMGLIPKDHKFELTKELEKKIIDTFGIIIINEFDVENNKKYPDTEIKDGSYMATRYLQLQHKDKKGRASGDGRSVWNGQVKHSGKTWDVSSCGTGATKLSPATAKFNKFFENGDPSISYGCGYAEIDEGIAQALFSEVFYQNRVRTERALVVLEFEKGYAINVRAHQNLLRPSHFFMYLKQNDLESLKGLLDFYIDSQRDLKSYENCPKGNGKYNFFLNDFAKTFGNISSTFENEYIFCWLDWDGDNILMDGSIIDYGSIRQFGMFHSEYRYDDVDRFSTSILEQRDKARYIVQTFAQVVDYVQNGEKKGIQDFKKHVSLENFDKAFEDTKNENILFKIGFNSKDSQYLLKNELKLVKEFRKVFSYFERAKSKKGIVKVPDGVSWDAIFCMRDILRTMPKMIITRKAFLEDEEFISILRSNYATAEDCEINAYRSKMIKSFQSIYWKLVKKLSKYNKQSFEKQMLTISMRSSVVNKMERVTGDSVSLIVERLLKERNKVSVGEVYKLIKDFAEIQNFNPSEKPVLQKEVKGLVKQFFEIVKEHREGL